jgi:class 3 adenylate cyclase/tetratricopeptide (TPR) repeat protein
MVCPSCGVEVKAGSKFCDRCGAAVAAASTPTASAARFASPESYTPRHLAERILTSKSALEGERKQVTVLFADLKGSMELLADRDPEDARKILDPVLERMMEAVHRYEGTVNQVMGDGIMALFGAPLAHEDHAVRACYSALRMQDVVRRYSEDLRREQGLEVQIRVGLNSGEVVVRSVGSDLRTDYTAVGQTTHLAARMEQLATPGTVRLTGETLRLAEGYVEVRSLGPIPVKGLSDPIEIFELTGGGQARTRLQAAAIRGLTCFVGRDAEVEHLRRILGQAGSGHGQVVAIVGEAGVGKSRLTNEFSHSHRVQDWRILEASSVSYGKAISYLPVVDLLKDYFNIGDRDNHREMRDKVMGRVLGLDRALEPLLSPLLGLLDVPVEDPNWQTLDPPQRRHRTLDTVKRLLLRESQVQPLIVVFEDLHWIDSETQALLDALVEGLPTARVLLLVNYRPEYTHGWAGKTYYTQLRIDALPAESAVELLDGLLGASPELAPLQRLLIERTEGNPLFLEESVRALVEQGALTGVRGGYRLARPAATLEVPATVQAVLAARIDRLPPEDKQLLQAAAVVGMDVSFTVLREATGISDSALQHGLARLQASEFLYEQSLFPELEYTFKHALTHDVAYDGLLRERRRELHGRIVEAIERLYAERLLEHIDRLARHAVAAERWEAALGYLWQAGRKAAARLALREAVACFEQAISAASHLPRRRAILEQSIDLRLDLRAALFPLGEHDRQRDHLGEAARIATEIEDQARLGSVTADQAHFHWIVKGKTGPALECARRALAIAESVKEPRLIGQARFALGQVLHGRGDYAEMITVLGDNVEATSGDLELGRAGQAMLRSVASRVWLAFALSDLGRFQEGIHTAEQALRQTEWPVQPYGLYHACWALCAVHLEQGEHEPAAQMAARIDQIAAESDALTMLGNARGLAGRALTLAGRAAEAVKLLQDPLVVSTGRNAFTRQRDLFYLGDAYLGVGGVDDARRTGEQVLELARISGQRGLEARALRLLGDVAAASEDEQGADKTYRHGLSLAATLDMRPLIAHCHLGLGKLYRRTGKREPAHDHLTTATTMYREMGMPYWLEQAEAEQRA